MRLSRLYCSTCKEETIHVSFDCCHCKTRYFVAALVPQLSDSCGSTALQIRRKRGGYSSKLNPRRALSDA